MLDPESLDLDDFLRTLQDPERHGYIDDGDLEEFMYVGLNVYGTLNREDLIPHLIHLYGELVKRLMSSARMNLLQAVRAKVEDKTLSVNALLPFIGFEPDQSIVSTSVIDYCMIRETDEDELAGVGDVIGIMNSGRALCPGGIIGGLLLLGDSRVVDLLERLPRLRGDQISDLVKTFSGFVYAPMIDFYLNWLEELNTSKTEADFGALASGLVNMVQNDRYGIVTATKRHFGKPKADPPIEVVSQQSFDDYFNKVVKRMEKIAESETEPKVMPEVIKRWHIHSVEISKKH